MEMAGDKTDKKGGLTRYQKSYFDVLGICCSSEVPLVEKILKSLPGVLTVSVIVPSRTVIVVHDAALVSQLDIVKALNQARLEATVRQYGKAKGVRHWPSPYTIACGVLLALSFLKVFYHPLKWLAVAAAAAGLPPIIHRALAAARRLTLDINILMLIAVGGSIALKDYWEAGSIVFLFTIAEWLESRASYKATSVMSALTSMSPSKAVLAGTGEVVDSSTVEVDSVLAVKAGEVIPIDGIVVDGRSEVDESSLTGESFPVAKQLGSQVWAGTLNINGYLSVKTTALAENSAVAKMTKLVEEAQNAKSKTQRVVDSCAKYYTPGLVLMAALLAILPLALKLNDVKRWLRLALVLLVSACPCALVLSTPVATFCALTSAARSGLLVKGGDFLETLGRAKVVAFDKTGTITRGEFIVVDFHPVSTDVSKESLLYWVSSVESKASHPMAAALVDFARSNSVEPKTERVSEFQIFPGEGIYGEIDGRSLYIGNQRIAARTGCAADLGVGKDMRGATVGYVFSGAELLGIFSLTDTCRTGVAEAIRELHRLRIKTAMLTGDSCAAAMFAQKQLGNALGVVHAELLPEDKVRILKELRGKEGPTVMVGDGMNDAPALLTADVGISMGISGSAVAMETSHITLMSNDVRKIPEAIRLGRRTRRKIIENLVLSVATKAAILALALSGHPLLWAAIVSDVGTCLLVIFNSMLLLNATRHGKAGRCRRSSHKGHAHGNIGAHHHGRDVCRTPHHGIEATGASRECCSHHGGRCGGTKDGTEEVKCSRDDLRIPEHGWRINLAPLLCPTSFSHDHAHESCSNHSRGHSHLHDCCSDRGHVHSHVHDHCSDGTQVHSHVHDHCSDSTQTHSHVHDHCSDGTQVHSHVHDHSSDGTQDHSHVHDHSSDGTQDHSHVHDHSSDGTQDHSHVHDHSSDGTQVHSHVHDHCSQRAQVNSHVHIDCPNHRDVRDHDHHVHRHDHDHSPDHCHTHGPRPDQRDGHAFDDSPSHRHQNDYSAQSCRVQRPQRGHLSNHSHDSDNYPDHRGPYSREHGDCSSCSHARKDDQDNGPDRSQDHENGSDNSQAHRPDHSCCVHCHDQDQHHEARVSLEETNESRNGRTARVIWNDGDSGRNEVRSAITSNKYGAQGRLHRGPYQEEEKTAVDLCAHRQDEVECLRYIACDKPAAFTTVSPPRNICLCGNFHRRYHGGSCRSVAGALSWSPQGSGRDLGGGGLPQWKEIVTE
ncbi:unnamed protein product [Spirodela intermedia]|uniref:HMA domain-containing protein n=1 Tax=Spirodela intermedia TaxID=51605 RepID=A0A7I8LDP4_SPIIN|nr:unnamed protein product [Spirodela intermedia]